MVSLAKSEQVTAALLASLKLGGVVFEATAGAALKTLSVKDIEGVSSSCKSQLKTSLLSVLCGGITADLPDSRDNDLTPGAASFGPHKVSRFFVPAGKGTVENQVRGLLGQDEVNSLTAHFNLKGPLPKLSELAYFWNSHDKARNRKYAYSRDKTTQEEDFNATSYAFGNDGVAVRFCAGLVSRARELQLNLTEGPDHWANSQAEKFNRFSEGEREILIQLRIGEIRTFSGTLSLNGVGGVGRLRARSRFSDCGRSDDRAFGSPPCPESKN